MTETEPAEPDRERNDPISIAIGSELAGHRIEAELGRGGMGVVYRARHLALDRERALKVIAPDLSGDERFRARFRREARAAAAIEHPNVIEVKHAGQEGGVLYISMALIEGEDLNAVIAREGALEPRRAASILAAIAGGVDAAHEHGLVHRDVKPSNVLIEHSEDPELDEHAYLTDFGVSRLIEADAGLTRAKEFLGSPDYAAPEQIEGERVDRRTDVYALGAVAHYMLTGSPPFPRRTAAAKLVAHSTAPRPRPSEIATELPPMVDDVIARAMAVRPADRFATPGELARALRRAVDPNAGARLGARLRARLRRPAIMATLLAAITLGTGALVAAMLIVGGADDLAAPPGGTLPGQTADTATTTIPVGEGPVSVELTDEAVWVASRNSGQLSGIDPRNPTAEPAQIPVGMPGPRALAAGFGALWVADPRAGELLRVDPAGGDGSPLARIEVGGFPSAVVADGRWIWVANTADGTVARVDPQTNAVDRSIEVGTRPRALATGAGSVWVANAGDSSISRIDPGAGGVTGEIANVGRRPQDLAVGAGSVWVVDLVGSRLRQIDVDEMAVVGSPIRVDFQPRAVAFGLGSVWVASSREGTVSRIDPATLRPVGEPVAVGQDPTDIGVGYGSVWTANFGDATVTRVGPP